MSKLIFDYITNDEGSIELENPAILLGNGINYTDKDHTISWTNLLISLFPKSYKEEKESILKKNEDKEDVFDLEGISYPEIAELAEIYNREDKTERKKVSQNNEFISIKMQICKKIDENDRKVKKDNKNENQKKLFEICKKNHLPVLSTNYDHSFIIEYPANQKEKPRYLDKAIEHPYWIFQKGKEITNKRRLAYMFYNLYFKYDGPFSINKLDIRNEFAIWPIHGTKRYCRSLCINNKDYAKRIADISKIINKNKKTIFTQNQWAGKYTWINIFLHNDLVILGLDLEENELDLRWLLVERYIYQKWLVNKKYKKEIAKTIFLYRKKIDKKTKEEIEIKKGKKRFFESIGIKCIKVDDSDMYQYNYLSDEKQSVGNS